MPFVAGARNASGPGTLEDHAQHRAHRLVGPEQQLSHTVIVCASEGTRQWGAPASQRGARTPHLAVTATDLAANKATGSRRVTVKR